MHKFKYRVEWSDRGTRVVEMFWTAWGATRRVDSLLQQGIDCSLVPPAYASRAYARAAEVLDLPKAAPTPAEAAVARGKAHFANIVESHKTRAHEMAERLAERRDFEEAERLDLIDAIVATYAEHQRATIRERLKGEGLWVIRMTAREHGID